VRSSDSLSNPLSLDRWTDPVDRKAYNCKVLFQVRIRPGSGYGIGQETTDAPPGLDPTGKYDNNELEWYTPAVEKGSIFLTNLLIQLKPV
jgi:hypothetical protein